MLCGILLSCAVEIPDEQDKMAVAWSRFDTDVAHLKRLSSQISEQGTLSVPATFRAQSRKQSAASRRAITALRLNVSPQGMPSRSGCGLEVVTAQNIDSVLLSPALLPLSQHAQTVNDVSRPCSLNAGFSNALLYSADSHVCHPTVCTSHIVASAGIERSPAVIDMESGQGSMQFTWSDQTDSHQPDESMPLVLSAGESGNVSYVSAVTSVAVTTVSTCRHSDNEACSRLRQLSSSHQTNEGSETIC